MMCGDEQWQSVEWLAGYRISDRGRVESVRRGEPRLMTPSMSGLRKDGRRQRYLQVCVHVDGRARSLKVHRLVMEAFVGACPHGSQVNHKDGDPHNNNLSNLEYVTGRQNMRHAVDSGLQPIKRGSMHPESKLTEDNVVDILRRLKHENGRSLAKEFGVHSTLISAIKHGRAWRHVSREAV